MRAALAVLAMAAAARACTNILISKGASADGSVMLSYNADDVGLFGSIDLRPAADHPPGSVRQVWDWDGQYYTGTIPEVNHTYNVVGNSNEWGVVITETTFGGRGDLNGAGTGAIMSYGDLIFTTLQRARSAREAIAIMDALCQSYGYESSGESFGVGDSSEVWLMELIGKGKYGKGAVWVASRVPEGYATSTANQARTRTFNQNDPDNVLFSPDVVSFARQIGAYNGTSDADFDFTAAYDPLSFTGARFAEARVWNVLNPICGGCLDSHLDFAQGYNLSNPMPLFVKAVRPLTLNDTITLMRTHFEGTWFDNTGVKRPDVGAGSGHSPYRLRPLVWQFNGSNYLNERTVGIQQSGWAFIAQSRSWLPDPIKAVEWFAPDDSSTSPRVPVYGGATRIPAAFGDRVGQTPGGGVPYAPLADAYNMNLDSAFWVWNLVGNIAWSDRYNDARPMVVAESDAADWSMQAAAAQMERDFVALYAVDPAAAVEFMTSFSENTGAQMMSKWTAFWMRLFATFRDGGIVGAPTVPQCGPGQTVNCTCKLVPVVNEVGYVEDWYGRIVGDSDNAVRYRVPASAMGDAEGEGADAARVVLERAKLAVVSGKRRAQAPQ